jgi:hypothetical protein
MTLMGLFAVKCELRVQRGRCNHKGSQLHRESAEQSDMTQGKIKEEDQRIEKKQPTEFL